MGLVSGMGCGAQGTRSRVRGRAPHLAQLLISQHRVSFIEIDRGKEGQEKNSSLALIGTGRRTWNGGLSGKFEEQMRSPFAEMGFTFSFVPIHRAQSRDAARHTTHSLMGVNRR